MRGLKSLRNLESKRQIFYNGSIITMNDSQPIAEAVAIEGEKIIAVGNLNDIESQLKSNYDLIDLKGNSLVLFSRIESHGVPLYELINNCKNKGQKVFFVHGGVDTVEREKVREITERENNAIIIASYGVFSTGINIKNLHNVIFASPSKSRIRNLQSIGRVLRKSSNKNKATLYDIADDCTYNSRKNYTLNHFIERIKIYNEEKFNYDIININLKQ